MARLVRVVRAAVERPAVGRQEDRHRPAALPGHRLDGAHVDLVEVGPLLAVHLDRHEVLVHVGRRGRVLERLALHDVAPVARGVADREEDRPVEQLRPGERVAAPREPVDRVVGVLEQVGARLAGEAVGHGPSVAHAESVSRTGVRAHRRWGQNRQIGTDLGNGSMVFVRRTEVRSLPATERWRLFAEVAVDRETAWFDPCGALRRRRPRVGGVRRAGSGRRPDRPRPEGRAHRRTGRRRHRTAIAPRPAPRPPSPASTRPT